MPTTPDREALRALFDEAVQEINQSRHDTKLTTDFYAQTGNGVFEAGYLALSDYCMGTKAPQRLHVVSAPAGGGKTSFSYALILAVTRYAERTPDAPYGCVFVVDQITKADEVYRELNALLPGKVAIWTKDHDPNARRRQRFSSPPRSSHRISSGSTRSLSSLTLSTTGRVATRHTSLSVTDAWITTGRSLSWMSVPRR